VSGRDLTERASLVELGAGDADRLATFCRRATDFFELVEGQPGGPETAAEILGPLPERVATGTKHVYGVEESGDLIGLVELLAGYPAADAWYVGLLVLVPERRRAGVGSRLWAEIRDRIVSRGGAVVRLVVQHQNAGARSFWVRQGFEPEREAVIQVGRLESRCWVMLRRL
jgi:ribosomal protein S18 acetylase RimI-like enzyme